MYYLVHQGGRTDYYYKEYYLDNANDLSIVPIEKCCPGSVCFIIDTVDVYMLNTEMKWIKIS